MTTHDPWCQSKALPHEDAAKRISDEYNLHRSASPYGSVGKWISCALHDGISDHQLYESKREAVNHQHHNEQWYTFIKIRPCTMTACEAAVMLRIARTAYDNGMRLADPDDRNGGRSIIKRTSREDMVNLSRGLVSNVTFGRN